MFDDYEFPHALLCPKKNKTKQTMITQLYCNDIKLDNKIFSHIFCTYKKNKTLKNIKKVLKNRTKKN